MSTPSLDASVQARSAPPKPLHLTRRDWAAIGLLVASLVGMFWKVIFTSEMFFYRDICNYTYPTTQLIRELCRQGTLPYWNPYLNYGQPVLANPNLLFFYPYTLLIILLPFDLIFTLHFIVHFALAGIGTYLLVRVWGQSYLAAFFAAFVFVFSGQMLSLGNLYNTVACCAWIPWALLATDRALESRHLRSWVLLTVVFALQWLAAEPLTMMATFGLCVAYAFYRCGARDRLWSKPNFRLLAIFFLVGCMMLLACAVQFLSAADMLNHSHRANGLSFNGITTWSMNPLSFLEILIPNFSGSPLAVPPGWIWLTSDRNFPYNPSNFLGFVPLFFALVGWAMGADRRRNFVAGAAGTLLLLSFGHFTPVFAMVRLLLPPLAVVRFPMKLLVHVTFLLAILAGWGFDSLRHAVPPWKARKRLTFPLQVFLGCTVLILGLAWLAPGLIMSPVRLALRHLGETAYSLDKIPDFLVAALRLQFPGLAGFCLGGLVLVSGLAQRRTWARPGVYVFALLAMGQLVLVNSEANPTVPKSFYTYRPPVLDEFKEPPGTYRFQSLWPTAQTSGATNLQTFINFQSLRALDGLPEIAQGTFQSRLQLAAGSMYYRVEGSISVDTERSAPPFLYDVEIYLERMKSDLLRCNCLLGRTNVKYILRPTPADSAATRAIGDVFNGSVVPSRLYEDLCFVPRAYVADNSLFSMSSHETLDHLASLDFDALNTVILAAPPGTVAQGSLSSPAVFPPRRGFGTTDKGEITPAPARTGSAPVEEPQGRKAGPALPADNGSAPAGQVKIVHREPNSVILRAQLARPGYVVLLDRYDPNWQATLDGRPARVLRANQIFRAVYAGPGQHEIRFDYHQHGLRSGLIISLLTLATLIVLSFINVEV